ncbi:MAG: hypothetical protein JO029_13060 [Candidatus Eremiobacteraeota bacterium]|nr:hypothetical protein [Candidatus Eremiobacteraeota bacterium]MBV8435203.1 hypothetical protein [Candidatus Eremiobacteraeota bacterium]MBV8654415.1 hypothetical protein [Candidatus Eremiobacteraeota bacterium]
MTSVFPAEGSRKTLMWNVVGFALASLTAVIAFYRANNGGGFYDREVYGMGPSAHRLYAAAFLAFAGFFAVAAWLRFDGGVYGLAPYALVAAFYATSFLRGAPDDE